ncbi:MAG: 50S ribosomal protein L9 [Candidatus Taylorbacteria bacterium RIFCSPHIGHO2_01_FULL_46_22b]|uniref:Large ribosomal subunit protein bL9 n=1 Tax=Candidatus Taylorbacteria bacterium RIFCSPHIGHO2_01_FULL_46_22b TaxID=1802301 RepID=A0A1G2M151_9BACT|nr:MAG: 50S ribosomal protein L9 [Candidatus Taylorbacteria bacterium RIFCSPHIGHO2_01_FULL_46_22b]
MKVIFLQDVRGSGKKFEVKDVSDGYAINMLIPRSLAQPATASALTKLEVERSRMAAEKNIQADLLHKNLSELEGKQIHFKVKASEQGHLFASIHKEDIVARLKEELRIDANPDFIELAHPLKSLGEHEIVVSVKDQKAKFKVIVEVQK